MTLSPVIADLFVPFPGRSERAAEVCLVCMLVVVVSMTFQIPSPDVSAYLIFFAAKPNSGLNILSCVVFVVVITVIVGILFVLAPIALNNPTLRIGVIGGVSFIAFFLESASKIAAVTGVFGIVTAYALDLLQESFVGELATRGFLYAWLFVCMPMAVFAAYSLVFGRHPERLLRAQLADRAHLAARHLRREPTAIAIRTAITGGNAALLANLGAIKLLRRQPADTLGRLAALVPLSYALLLSIEAWAAPPERFPLPQRLDQLADRLRCLPDTVPPRAAGTVSPPWNDLADQTAGLITAMENVVAGETLPKSPASSKQKAGFFATDAFKNPLHTRFALKGALAVIVCYVAFNLLDWPGIHTCLITCFVVALKTVGESLQKMILRLSGCIVGAVLGLAAIVYVLPHTTSITSLAVVVGLATLPAAWVAVGKPSVSYVGFQIALAAYLCVLQGTEPKFDLTLARDRMIGVLFGNVVVYLIFTRVFPVSILNKVKTDLAHLLIRCRGLSGHGCEGRMAVAIAGDVAEIQAMMNALEADAATLLLEYRGTRRSRCYALCIKSSVRALRTVTSDLARFAIHPVPAANLLTADPSGAAALETDLGAALDRLVKRLAPRTDQGGSTETKAEPERPRPVVTAVALGDHLATLRSSLLGIQRLETALERFRRLSVVDADA
jgi:multidrug resistance protein MdtO